jgi:hypothetical protein
VTDVNKVAQSDDAPLPRKLLPGFLFGHIAFRIVVGTYIFTAFAVSGILRSQARAWIVPLAIIVVMTGLLKAFGGLHLERYNATIHLLLDDKATFRWFRFRKTSYTNYPMHQLFIDVFLIGWLVAETHGMSSVFFLLFPIIMASGDLALHGTGSWAGNLTVLGSRKRLWKRNIEFSAVVVIVLIISCVAAYRRWIPQIDELELVIAKPVHLRGGLYWITFAWQLLMQGTLGYVAHRTSEAYIDHMRRAD